MTGDDEPDDDSSPGIGTSSSKRVRKLAWIAEADAEKAAERLDRLAGDRELASDLERAGYAGRHYELFANEIAKYGWAVICAWIYKGQIRAEVQQKGFGALSAEPRPGAMVDNAESLADETVVRALTAFRDKVLVPGKWDPNKGASLRTFFVGQCLLQFSNVYRTWCREEISYVEPWEPNPRSEMDDFEEGPSTPLAPDADETAIIRDELRRAFGKITDQRARAAFYLNAVHGYTHAEIGVKLGMTGKAVESAMARARLQASTDEKESA